MPIQNVVYILGAGFSAPLGLPVMRTFLSRSKDIFAGNPERFAHFKTVFDSIGRMSVAKNYFNTDLFNIEEILSLLEMARFAGNDSTQPPFIQYLKDTILELTPPISANPATFPSNWHRGAFGKPNIWAGYGYFVSNILGVSLGQTIHRGGSFWQATPFDSPAAKYSVISLNYDCVLEQVVTFLRQSWQLPSHVGFSPSPHGPGSVSDGVVLAKLHGSVDTDVIVPPTWNKGAHQRIVPAWAKALEVLNQANHIRIIGYSLPITDSYVRYLLTSGVFQAPNLKSIDVICWDPDGSVKARYDHFIAFQDYRFLSAKTQDYLAYFLNVMLPRGGTSPRWYDELYRAHDEFMLYYPENGTRSG